MPILLNASGRTLKQSYPMPAVGGVALAVSTGGVAQAAQIQGNSSNPIHTKPPTPLHPPPPPGSKINLRPQWSQGPLPLSCASDWARDYSRMEVRLSLTYYLNSSSSREPGAGGTNLAGAAALLGPAFNKLNIKCTMLNKRY